MEQIHLHDLTPVVAQRIGPFFHEILEGYPRNVHSLHLVGSALTPDFREKTSVIHSVIVLHNMDFSFIRFLAPLGRKYRKKGVAAPLVLTPDSIRDSLDVFPVEFHDFRLIHRTVWGEDIFSGLNIDRRYLRLQCEREIKTRLVGLRQSYISSLGEKGRLTDILSQSIVGCMPLLRAVTRLSGKEPPVKRREVVLRVEEISSLKADVFEELLQLRAGVLKPSREELQRLYEEYHALLEKIGGLVDALQAGE